MTNSVHGDPIVDDPEISLKELILKLLIWWRFILSKWFIILIGVAIGCLVGLAYAYSKKATYKAELSFAIQNDNIGGANNSSVIASQFGIDLGNAGGSEFLGDNLLQLMKSRFIVEKALLSSVVINNNTQTLAEFYINFNNIRKRWKDDPKLKDVHFLPNINRSNFNIQQDSILGEFHKELVSSTFTVTKAESSIISLQVNSTNELFSKYFAETLAKVVSDFYIETKTEKSSKNVMILKRQTDSVRRVLNAAISGVAMSADVNPNPNPSLQIIRVPAQRKQFDVQANTTILSELVKNLETAKMSLLQETPLIQIIDRPILPLEKDHYSKKKGIIIGILAGGFIAILIVSTKRFFKKIML